MMNKDKGGPSLGEYPKPRQPAALLGSSSSPPQASKPAPAVTSKDCFKVSFSCVTCSFSVLMLLLQNTFYIELDVTHWIKCLLAFVRSLLCSDMCIISCRMDKSISCSLVWETLAKYLTTKGMCFIWWEVVV